MEPVPRPPRIAGRVSERARLLDLVRLAGEGHPGAVLLHGEAGVGKTALVRSIAAKARLEGAQVLWGTGQRFDSANALLLPVTMALDRWLRDASPTDREHVLAHVPDAAAVLPSIGDLLGEGPPARQVVVVDALVSRILELGPMLLVIDDLQWADPASRGALAYLIAGFARQRLALVIIYRDEDSRGNEDFRSWIADMRRMSSVDMVALNRLDRDETGVQLTSLLGVAPTSSLLVQVFERSQGNAYLNELLVSETDAYSDALPEPLPAALNEALLSAWRRLGPGGRTLTCVLAVAGRPTDMTAVRDVMVELEGAEPAASVWHEAVDAGIVVLERQTVWFRHPLLSEVLLGELLPGEAAPIHAAWAGMLLRCCASGIDEVRRQAAIAIHCEAAGDARGAFDAYLRAADLTDEQRSPGEAARNLVRAASLWTEGAPRTADTTALLTLLERAAHMCCRAEQGDQGLTLLARALELVDEGVEPLRASRLLMEWADLQWEQGELEKPDVDVVVRAARLAQSVPDSPEYAEALAMVSNGLRWSGLHGEAAARAEEGVRAAQRSGSARALSKALGARASTRTDLLVAYVETQQALSYARESGDDLSIDYAYGACARVLVRMGHLDELILLTRQALEHAVEHGRGAPASSVLASALLFVGELKAAGEALREGLSLGGMTSSSVALRLHAAVLAGRLGDQQRAHMHRSRAYEVMPSLERRLGAFAVPALAEVLLGESNPVAALQLVLAAMPAAAVDPMWLDVLVLWGARAAADLVERGNDAQELDILEQGRVGLADLVSLRAGLPGVPYTPTCDTDLVRPAMAALFEAERRRATGAADQVTAWREAAAACEQAGMLWDQHQAQWRLADELVRATGRGSAAASVALRSTHRYAAAQNAEPLQRRVEQTGTLGRISLTEPVQPSWRDSGPTVFAQLTGREAEILAHLVAKRTNADIAAQLNISEKTVSVHVSNLMRKTSTGSRREVAALAIRLGWRTEEAP